MTSLVRLSRNTLIRFSRTSATTSTSSGGARVQPSGASKNLSEASRAADGTDMAMRDAAQRGTTTGATNPKSANQQANTPKSDGSSPYGKVGLGLVLAVSAYLAYKTFVKSPDPSKSSSAHTETGKRDSRAHSADRDVSSGKKH